MSLQQSSPRTEMTATCRECGSAMRISAVTPTMFGNGHEDITYRCKDCGNMRRRKGRYPWNGLSSLRPDGRHRGPRTGMIGGRGRWERFAKDVGDGP